MCIADPNAEHDDIDFNMSQVNVESVRPGDSAKNKQSKNGRQLYHGTGRVRYMYLGN